MSIFPRIASPCPYKKDLDAVVVGDWCRMCERKVVDVTDMSDAEKVALFSDCSETPCVRYSLPLVAMAATLAIGSAAMATPAEHPRHHVADQATSKPPAMVLPVMHTAGLPAMPPQWERYDTAPTNASSNPLPGAAGK